MKRRPYIPSRARAPKVQRVVTEEVSRDEYVQELRAEVARLKASAAEADTRHAAERETMRAKLWELTKDEAYAPASYWSGVSTYGT